MNISFDSKFESFFSKVMINLSQQGLDSSNNIISFVFGDHPIFEISTAGGSAISLHYEIIPECNFGSGEQLAKFFNKRFDGLNSVGDLVPLL